MVVGNYCVSLGEIPCNDSAATKFACSLYQRCQLVCKHSIVATQAVAQTNHCKWQSKSGATTSKYTTFALKANGSISGL